jgi:hypothetical protein
MPQDAPIKDNIKAYQETCNTIRHYSNSSYNVRVFVIVQGFVLLGAWILNFQKASINLLLAISIFGLVFTALLYAFHHGYFYATDFFYKTASKMENKLFDEDFKPFKAYEIVHDKKYKSSLSKIFILYAPFTLTFSLFLATLIITLSKCSK